VNQQVRRRRAPLHRHLGGRAAPAVSEDGGAIVYNVDGLKEMVAANKEERARAGAEAEVLLAEEQLSFEA